jgi:hypothetical protein
VRSAATTKKLILNVPSSIGQKLSQHQGRATLTLFDAELVDAAGDATDLISTEKASPLVATLVNAHVTLYSGYADLVEADFAPVAIAQVQNVVLSSNGRIVKLKLSDLRRHQQDDVMRNADANGQRVETTLAAAAAAGARTIFVIDAGNSNSGDRLYLGPSAGGAEEKVIVNGVNKGVSPHRIDLAAPLSNSFELGKDVRWATTLLVGNPINIMHSILRSNFADASFPLLKTRGQPTGLGMSAAHVNSTAIAAERDDMYAEEIWTFEFQQPRPGFRFLEEKIHRWLGYPIVHGDGRVGFRCFRPARPGTAQSLTQITAADVQEFAWSRRQELHANRLVLGLDFDEETGESSEDVVVEDAADQTSTKETIELEALDSGLMAAQRGRRLAEERGRAMLRRYLKPPVQLEIQLGLTKRAIEMGDVVELTHPDIPDVTTGARGITKKRLEVVERTEDFSANRLRLVLQDAGFSRPAWIAPDAAPDYGAASAADKEFMYIAPDAGDFADGGKPYEIV